MNKTKIQKKIFKKIFGFLICTSLVLTMSNFTFADEQQANPLQVQTIQGIENVAENDRYILKINSNDAWICIVDKVSGASFYSSPVDALNDTVAQGINKMILPSMINIEYYSVKKEISLFTPCYSGSVKRNNFYIQKINNGVKIVFNFLSSKIKIPVDLTLEKDYLSFKIDTAKIEEDTENKLLKIDVMPFFGAVLGKQKGFIFLPDGSGAITYLDKQRSKPKVYNNTYSQDMYGDDFSLLASKNIGSNYQANLPVMGISTELGGFVGIMTKGEAQGRLTADIAGTKTNYNNAYFSFKVRSQDEYILNEKEWNPRRIPLFQKQEMIKREYEIRYYSLDKNENSYIGMANKYRNYLINEKGLKKNDNKENQAVEFSFIGGFFKQKSFLGFLFDTYIPLSSFKDIQKISEESKFVSVISITNWSKDGTKGLTLSNLSPASQIGGEKQLKELAKTIKENGSSIYLDTNILSLSTESGFLNRFFSSSKRLSGYEAIKYTYSINTYEKYEKNYPMYYLLLPNLVEKTAKSRINNINKFGVSGSGLGDAANELYTNFEKIVQDKESLAQIVSNSMDNTRAGTGGLYTISPNQYAMVHSDFISQTPSSCNYFNFEDEAIPFYQIVISGYIPFSVENSNAFGSPEDRMLRAVETGGMLSFSMITQNADKLMISNYSQYMSYNYDNFKDYALKKSDEILQVRKAINGFPIKTHTKISENVYKTVFENGVSVIVNYNNEDYKDVDFTVSKKGYKLFK